MLHDRESIDVSSRETLGAHAPVVRRALRRLGVPPELLDDAVQDVFTVVVRREGDFERGRSFTNWLWGIARGVASTHRRALGRRARLHAALAIGTDDAPGADDLLARDEASRKVAAFVDGLPPHLREVFVLAHLHGCSGPEIAAQLGLNLNTAYARIRTTRLKLEAELLAEPPSFAARMMRVFAPWFAIGTTSIAAVGVATSMAIGVPTPALRSSPSHEPVVARTVVGPPRAVSSPATVLPSPPPLEVVAFEAETIAVRMPRPVRASPVDPPPPPASPDVVVVSAQPLAVPDGACVVARMSVALPSMISPRGDFVPELMQLAVDL